METESNQMRCSLLNFALAIDRTGVSLRNAGIIANALMQDLGLITTKDTSMVIDLSKIVRELKKLHKLLENNADSTNNYSALYFDGRKDLTVVQEKHGAKYFRKEIKEEHVTLLKEPGGIYLDHLSPKGGTAVEVLQCICEYLDKTGYDYDNLGNEKSCNSLKTAN